MDKENEYKEIFLAEAIDNFEELNKLFTVLEKNSSDKKTMDSIFRITHTMKGNAMGMGFEGIAGVSHILEDVFSEVKEGSIEITSDLFEILFKVLDKLGELITALKTNEEVKYKGIKAKLEVFLRNARKNKEDSFQESNYSNNENISELIDEDEQDNDKIINEDNLSKVSFSDLVQIPVRKLDGLLNLVGELIIERDGLIARGTEKGNSSSEYARLQRITSDLQYGVMDVRLVQIGFLFNKFHRVVRDTASIEEKKVNLILEGTEVEIDRNILKIMSDSLIHLIRNSVGHGIEKPNIRKSAGKDEIGNIYLRARSEKDSVIIEIEDDGNGIDITSIKRKAIEKNIITKEFSETLSDNEIIQIIFEPGFSNSDKISGISGRGVGMDVVKKATESIGGKIDVKTKLRKGTVISLTLPSSMAVKGALLFILNKQEYAVALAYTEAVVSIKKQDLHIVGSGLITKYLEKSISVIFLQDLFALKSFDELYNENIFHQAYSKWEENTKLELLIVSYNNKYFGLVVDKLLQQKEIVEKTLSKPIDTLELFSGATILGNGNICLVLDIAAIANACFKEKFIQKNIA
jgi:two-component system chemotaxis sensor kinase CheA